MTMRKSAKLLTLILFALSGATLLLSGCHTVAGAGKDVSQAGTAVEKSANKHAP
jgi:predicted small secreted protein